MDLQLIGGFIIELQLNNWYTPYDFTRALLNLGQHSPCIPVFCFLLNWQCLRALGPWAGVFCLFVGNSMFLHLSVVEWNASRTHLSVTSHSVSTHYVPMFQLICRHTHIMCWWSTYRTIPYFPIVSPMQYLHFFFISSYLVGTLWRFISFTSPLLM